MDLISDLPANPPNFQSIESIKGVLESPYTESICDSIEVGAKMGCPFEETRDRPTPIDLELDNNGANPAGADSAGPRALGYSRETSSCNFERYTMELEVGGEASAAQSGLFHSEIPKSQSTVVNETPKLQSVVANSRREFFGIPTNVNSSLGVIFESQEWGGSIAEASDCESREVNLPPSNVWTDSQIESIATKGSELKFFPCEDHELSQTVVEEDSTEVDSGGLVEDQVQDDIPWDSNLDQYPAKMKIRTGMNDLEKTIGAYYVFDKMSSREIALPQFSTTLKIADFISANGIQCCFLYVAIGKDLVFTHACGMVIFDPGGVFTLFVTEIRQMTPFPSEVEVTREAEFFSLRWQWDPGGMACLLGSLLRAAFSVFGGSGTSASMKTEQVLGIG